MLAHRIQRCLSWFGGLAIVGLIGIHCVAPALVGRALRDTLETSGFTDATFEVESVGIDDLRLADVRLGTGLVIGDIAIDAGISLLWRSPSSAGVTVRDARVTSAALRDLARAPMRAPFGRLVLDRAELAFGGGRVIVSGSVDLRSQAIDLVARLPSWQLGRLSLRDVVATARGDGTRTDVCMKGRVATATLVACGTLPPSLAALEKLRELDVTWRMTAREWHGRGTGTLAWSGGELALKRGHAELEARATHLDAATLHRATVVADVRGGLSRLALDLVGEARAKTLELRAGTRAATLHDLALGVALHVTATDVRATKPLVATATRATLEVAGATATVTRPALTIARAGELVTWPRAMSWTATGAKWRGIRVASPSGTIGDEQTIAWSAITGLGPIDAGAGEVAFQVEAGRVSVASGRVALAGGMVSAAPFVVAGRAPVDVNLRIERVALARVLRAFGRGRLEGTGALDGELAVRIDGDDVTVVRAALRTRGRGVIRSSDAAWRAKTVAAASGDALQRRLLAALSELEYDDLHATLGPRGAVPELRVVVRGRGKHVPQALDLVVNVRGVRDAASHLARVGRELE